MLWLSQNFVVPLRMIMDYKSGWVVHHRVFFDAIHSRTRRLERSLILNPENPQSLKLPLNKEIQLFLTKLRKVESKIKELVPFFAETE